MFCRESALFLQDTVVFLLFLGVGYMNKVEGQIRIPSGCAISAVISKEGKRMTGPMVSAEVLQLTASIPRIRIFLPYICFWMTALPGKAVKPF